MLNIPGLTSVVFPKLHSMDGRIRLLLFFATLALAGASSASDHEKLKIACVNMKEVFLGYNKTKEAQKRINEQRNAISKELQERVDEYKKKADAVQKLNDDISQPDLSQEGKETKRRSRDEKVNELKAMEGEMHELQTTRENQIQEEWNRARSGIVDEINKVVNDCVKANAFDLVLDRSQGNLFSKEAYDFTAEVIRTLNNDQPAGKAQIPPAPTGAEAPAAPAAIPKAK
jgi:Skp family chaperone for outer membrane proteins